ncbi:MAG: putative metal-binding motif-containing protein, partial [Deltaproteobacteria bacterium]|nr:putative metal-binding motif-containing protein [Deltaproteobacteria bacterium]
KDDCDDMRATVFTGATEVCSNDVDEDCDGIADNPSRRTCTDGDGDGHGNPASIHTIMTCTIPAGQVPEVRCDDCDDVNPQRFPGNREICDRVDNDCSTPGSAVASDEDQDGDGYSPPTASCSGRGETAVLCGVFESRLRDTSRQ